MFTRYAIIRGGPSLRGLPILVCSSFFLSLFPCPTTCTTKRKQMPKRSGSRIPSVASSRAETSDHTNLGSRQRQSKRDEVHIQRPAMGEGVLSLGSLYIKYPFFLVIWYRLFVKSLNKSSPGSRRVHHVYDKREKLPAQYLLYVLPRHSPSRKTCSSLKLLN